MSRREAMRRVANAGGSFEYCSLIKNGKTGKLKRAEDLKQKGHKNR